MIPQQRSLRIAALQPSVSVTLDRLGCLESLVACTRYCLEAVPALGGRSLKVIADSWSSSTEEILSASPDLVLASVPYRLESLAAILKCGVPVLTLAPHSLADIYQDIRLLGSILHVPDRAEAVIDEGVRGFGIPPSRVISARAEVVGGVITSKLLDVPTGEGKAQSLVKAGVAAPDVVFGNSVHDAAMLEIARQAFPVDPTPALLAIATQHGWPVFYPDGTLPGPA